MNNCNGCLSYVSLVFCFLSVHDICTCWASLPSKPFCETANAVMKLICNTQLPNLLIRSCPPIKLCSGPCVVIPAQSYIYKERQRKDNKSDIFCCILCLSQVLCGCVLVNREWLIYARSVKRKLLNHSLCFFPGTPYGSADVVAGMLFPFTKCEFV